MKLFVLACIAGSLLWSQARADGKWTSSTYTNSAGTKTYYTYVPSSYHGAPMPLMVMIHGCTENATSFAGDTGMNALAEKYGFIALYPQQDSQSNSQNCWNFFQPENQVRGGEPSIIVGMVGQVEASYAVSSDQVYVAGLSSGAAMTAILGACYPDVFSGAAIASGLEFEAATTVPAAYTAMAMGSSTDPAKAASDAVKCAGAGARAIKIFAIQGTSDYTVSVKNLPQVVSQFVSIDNLLSSNSVGANPVKTTQGQVPNGRAYTVDYYGDATHTLIEKVQVQGMAHAWSGGAQAAQYVDQTGPNASEMLWAFFHGE